VVAKPDGRGSAIISGDPNHPANFGRLCSKGSALAETLDLGSRLLHPMLRRADQSLVRVDWTTALETVAGGLTSIIARHGPNAVAFYLSGQLLTEDYYVANKLMKGFIGSANVDTNSRLCMASSVAGHRRAFGSDTVPGSYRDIDEADLIVLVGSNAAWCHPVLFQRMVANRRTRGARIVVIDPRRTATAEEADLFLPIAPGTDTALFCGLLRHLVDWDAIDRNYITKHTSDFAPALARAGEIAPDIAAIAAATGVADADLELFFQWFRTTTRVVTCFSQGVNQSAQGTDKVNAIVNCHLATGRIGRPGMGPFSLTGQPNAMGGREVGGLANQLAAHMGFSSAEVDRVSRFWCAPNMARREGLKAVQMFDAIERGEIRALWVMATNPAVSLPDAGRVREALKKLELFVVSENVHSNDTVNCGAHLLLPAAAWGEKDGTVTNSERRISRQRPFMSLPGEARPDWWIVAEVGKRMGFADAFSFRSAADVFREHAALSAFENDGSRDFDLGGLADIADGAFETLEPIQWPLRAGAQAGQEHLFAEGGFFTSDGKARFIAPEPPQLRETTSPDYPLRLNTGRIRDQWHTMTRTGLSPRLSTHLPEPLVEIHPQDAQAARLADGGYARITTRYGASVVKVAISDGQRPGSLFVPIHWSAETSACARVGDLVNPHTDPFSGQPEAKATPARIEPIVFAQRGFILARRPLNMPQSSYWTRVCLVNGYAYLLATNKDIAFWRDFATRLSKPAGEIAEYVDAPRHIYRSAVFMDGRLDTCVFVGPADTAPQWDSVKTLFEAETIEPASRRLLLSDRPTERMSNVGPVVCACFGVGRMTIEEAIQSGATDPQQIGERLKAGTNCGSCLPELRKIIAQWKKSHESADAL
jgi:assimilatory nitrate reductase catalytic subunit